MATNRYSVFSGMEFHFTSPVVKELYWIILFKSVGLCSHIHEFCATVHLKQIVELDTLLSYSIEKLKSVTVSEN